MCLTAKISGYEMDQVILDLGSDTNVLPKHTWKFMEEPKLQWSTIQLCMGNQHKIIPLGRLSQVVVHIEGVKVLANFEVIQIVDDTNPYAALFGLYWATEMDGIINLKRKSMAFENNGTIVVVPLDPIEGARYTKLVCVENHVNISIR